MSGESKISFDGANIGGVNIESTVYGNQIGTQHNYVSPHNLAQAIEEIQQIFSLIAQNNPAITESTNQAVVIEAIHQEIKCNRTLKDRLVNALKTGSTEALTKALEIIFNNPLMSISVETIKGFIEVE